MAPMEHPDSKGYYRILGMAPHASDVALAKAYRERRKALAGREGRLGGDMQQRALEDAWQTLSDPVRREAYDLEALTACTGGASGPDDGGDPVACTRCNSVTAQPRFLTFHRVAGGITRVSHERLTGIYCARCARDVAVGASLLTWMIGWWGFPNGPAASVRAILANARGGDFPRAPNARLLAWQAHSFLRAGKPDLARAVARVGLRLDPDGPHAAALTRLIGEQTPPMLRNQWLMMRAGAALQLFPVLLALAVLVLVITGITRGG
ncbi:MAG: J domain-containing protein [Nitrospirota bacterium]|nr:J domain-containing protein [Nitrospirota bacterium]